MCARILIVHSYNVLILIGLHWLGYLPFITVCSRHHDIVLTPLCSRFCRYPDYYRQVASPISLSCMRTKLDNAAYTHLRELEADMRQVFRYRRAV